MQTLKNIVNAQGGPEALMRGEAVRARAGRRALVVEYAGASPRRRHAVRAYQYDERLGDVIRSPEMLFETDGFAWLPYYYRNDADALTVEAFGAGRGKRAVNRKEQKRLFALAREWERRIAEEFAGAEIDAVPGPFVNDAPPARVRPRKARPAPRRIYEANARLAPEAGT